MGCSNSAHASAAPAGQGAEAAADASNKLGKYEDPRTLIDILRQQDVRLVKSQFLIDYVKNGKEPLPCRQDLPEHAFLDVEELGPQGCQELRIISISYCWGSKVHPDPRREHLITLAALLELYCQSCQDDVPLGEKVKFEDCDADFGGKGKTVAVFFDWCSLFQDPPEQPRTEEQTKSFKAALKSINVWYAHRQSTTWMFTYVPEGSQRATYEQSGWTYFERTVSSIMTPTYNQLRIDADNRLKIPEFKTYYKYAEAFVDTGRTGPIIPADFDKEVGGKTFTNGSDKDAVVKPNYSELFGEVLEQARSLDLGAIGLDTAGGSQVLRAIEGYAKRLRVLSLVNNSGIVIDANELRVLRQLSDLNLKGCSGLNGDVAVFSDFPDLERLSITGCEALFGNVSAFSRLQKLKRLGLCSGVTGNLSSLSGLVNLQELHLFLCASLSGDLSAIAGLKQLKDVMLTYCSGVSGDISTLAGLLKLEHWDASGCGLRGDVSVFARLEQLKRVDVSGCAGLSGDVSAFAGLRKLARLNLTGCDGLAGDRNALWREGLDLDA